MNNQRPASLNRVAILDAGGQYVDLVRKAVLRQDIPADVLPLNTPRADIEKAYAAIIISGSPANTSEGAAPKPATDIWDSPLPLLGICFGMQAMVVMQGGAVTKNAIREDGRVTTTVDNSHPLFTGCKADFTGLFTHGDFVTAIPEGFTVLGSHRLSDGSKAYSSIAKGNKVGVQFHPEVFDDTPEGYQLFKNFLFGIAGLSADEFYHEHRLAEIIASKRCDISDQVGDRHVIAFVSGGVDSSVAAMLASTEVKPEKFHAFYIDSGFMRFEDELVIEALQAAGLPVQKVEAADQFEEGKVEIDGASIGPLSKVTDPEHKRKIIGKIFVQIQNDLVAKLNLTEALLLQGTNAADRIESGHSTGDHHTMTIKSHHNQVKEVQELKAAGMLLEPIDDLFKDEVRELGRELGLPEDLVKRQPFPGPGLAIRILCTDSELPGDFPTIDLKDAQLLPIRSVGVGGDERSHLYVAAAEFHETLTATELAALGADLPSHHRDLVNRVIYALTPGSVNKYTLTKTYLTSDARAQLRSADAIVHEEMRAGALLDKIAQFPTILIPLSFGEPGKRSIVLRPVSTSTFMTVQAMLPSRDLPTAFLTKIAKRILAEVPGISQVFLDITNKPPATTEWE